MKWLLDYFHYRRVEKEQERFVKRVYYRDATFFQMDQALLSRYIFCSPYRISKSYLKKEHADDFFTYGETPLKTYDKIAKEVGLTSEDHVLELGCGRGRGIFFLSHFYRCQVSGIERIPQFVKLATHIAGKFQIQNVSFTCGDMLASFWPKATFIYLYGTCLCDEEIHKVIDKLQDFPKGTRILSVSYPLTDYDPSVSFELKKSFPIVFPWGETDAYFHVKT